MRSWKLKALAALLAGLLAFMVAGTPGLAVADDAVSSAYGQSGAGSAAAALPAPAAKPGATDPAQDPVEPTDTLLVFGGGLLVLALAAIGLTITFRSLLGDLRNRRNRYRRRAKREPRGA
jgi:Alphavirus glycoprotein J